MPNRVRDGLLAVFLAWTAVASAEGPSAAKTAAVAGVDRQRADMVRMSDQIWAFAETALRETRSAALLADYAQQHGFAVERGVAGMPTAFVTTYGSGPPVIGLMGEYDAPPGISQKVPSTKEALEPGAAGQGCAHNLFGTASLAAAVAVKELIASGTLRGTVRFYGTPAEEKIGGKIYRIREGLFRDVDVVLVWHPGDETKVRAFAKALQRATGKDERGMVAEPLAIKPIAKDPPGGSTDVGDVSWVAPTLHFSVATAPKDVPWHAWPVVAASGTTIGHKGMGLAASTTAATAVDLFEKDAVRDAIRAEFAQKTPREPSPTRGLSQSRAWV